MFRHVGDRYSFSPVHWISFSQYDIVHYCNKSFSIFHKRLKFILWNINRMPPTKEFVRKQPDLILAGWNDYDVQAEFERQNVSADWTLSKINLDNSISDSYPKLMYLPAKTLESDIRGCATFRSKVTRLILNML